jgi:hypothetical protein
MAQKSGTHMINGMVSPGTLGRPLETAEGARACKNYLEERFLASWIEKRGMLRGSQNQREVRSMRTSAFRQADPGVISEDDNDDEDGGAILQRQKRPYRSRNWLSQVRRLT